MYLSMTHVVLEQERKRNVVERLYIGVEHQHVGCASDLLEVSRSVVQVLLSVRSLVLLLRIFPEPNYCICNILAPI